MLQQDEPDDYVVATGETHTVREFCQAAFAHAGLDWERYVRVDARYFRPTEVDDLLRGCPKAARGWAGGPGPASRSWSRLMVDADIALLEDELAGRTVRIDRP